MAKKKVEPVLTVDQIRELVAHAKRYNATTMTIKNHNCKNFDGWCFQVTVCEHSECQSDEEE